MGYLKKLLNYKHIYIQCHDNPDADAIGSAFGMYRYFQMHGVDASIIYGGKQEIEKYATKLLVKECGIPIIHTHAIEKDALLLLVDCQYGATNVEKFPASHIAMIDHHVRTTEENDNCFIKENYQCCCTIVYELLKEEGYCVREDEALSVALLYGLYTDTACFADLFGQEDMDMRRELYADYTLFDRLTKSNMSVEELLVATDAMYHHYLDTKYRFAIVSALECEQTILGVIGDFIIQVDAVNLSFAYSEADAGYRISLRSCDEKYPANEIAAYVCDGIGGGGGHKKKAGGQIVREKMIEKYGSDDMFNIVNHLLRKYLEENL
jgi:nanoRNase/pAp phosphatase (c-di-AMP/oligoRNAs hydrolase)